jgi:hypothetical protein
MSRVTTTTVVEFEHPEPVENPTPDWSYVLGMARQVFEADKNLQHDPKDIGEYIYEGVMQAVYGKAFWSWHNERIDHKK